MPNLTQPILQKAQICKECKYRIPKGCALLIRPCRITMIWAGEYDAPELCPNKELFDSCDSNSD